MKKIITLLAIAVLSITSVSAQKYGHVNAQEVLKSMPEYLSAQKEMERYGKQKEKELVMMQSAFKSDYQKYELEAKDLSPEIRESREKDLLETQQTIQSFQQKVQEKLQKKELDLLDPIIKKVREAIKAIGKANKYTYIFDTSVGALLYFEDGNDVTELLKKELTKGAAKATTPAGK